MRAAGCAVASPNATTVISYCRTGGFGGRARTRTGTFEDRSADFKSTQSAFAQAPLRTRPSPQKPRNIDDIEGNTLTGVDILCHRLPKLSQIGADTLRTRREGPSEAD